MGLRTVLDLLKAFSTASSTKCTGRQIGIPVATVVLGPVHLSRTLSPIVRIRQTPYKFGVSLRIYLMTVSVVCRPLASDFLGSPVQEWHPACSLHAASARMTCSLTRLKRKHLSPQRPLNRQGQGKYREH